MSTLTELNRPEKTVLYRNVQSIATSLKKEGLKLQEISEFLQGLDAGDFTDMGITDSQVQADLTAFRNAIDAIVTTINAQEAALDAVRYMNVI